MQVPHPEMEEVILIIPMPLSGVSSSCSTRQTPPPPPPLAIPFQVINLPGGGGEREGLFTCGPPKTFPSAIFANASEALLPSPGACLSSEEEATHVTYYVDEWDDRGGNERERERGGVGLWRNDPRDSGDDDEEQDHLQGDGFLQIGPEGEIRD